MQLQTASGGHQRLSIDTQDLEDRPRRDADRHERQEDVGHARWRLLRLSAGRRRNLVTDPLADAHDPDDGCQRNDRNQG
jgi:hypothetical protein